MRIPRLARRLPLGVLLAVCCAGCASPGVNPAAALAQTAANTVSELLAPVPVAPPPSPMRSAIQSRSKVRAIAVAQREAHRHGWPGMTIVHTAYEWDRWEISLARLPLLPNGHATVTVSDDGELLDFSTSDG